MTPPERSGAPSDSPTTTPHAPAVSVARMQEIDAEAIDTLGIPRLLLMEHAGLALARSVVTSVVDREPGTRTSQRTIVVCCGTGYNGGDGMAAARHLHLWGFATRIALFGAADRLREEPATFATILRRLRVPLLEVTNADALPTLDPWMAESAVIVDALLGIGVRGAVREPIRQGIDRINHSGKPVVSADIPSGLDGDTGRPQGAAVNATITVTFGMAKRGCVTVVGAAHVGTLVVDSITIPSGLLKAHS